MDIVVLSGKGGTGKTTVSTNLAKVMGFSYLDCDVEEPNGYIFLKEDVDSSSVALMNPVFNDQCIGCKRCVEACEYNALALIFDQIHLVEELCHGCGACLLVCQSNAVSETQRDIGICKIGHGFGMGQMNIKEPMGGPIITALKQRTQHFENRLIDSPPGTSCSVVKAAQNADYALLVTEPTRFGLHDLKKAVALVSQLKIPFGVLINGYDGPSIVDDYLIEEEIVCIGKIKFSKKAAKMYSRGILLIEDDEFKAIFLKIAANLLGRLS